MGCVCINQRSLGFGEVRVMPNVSRQEEVDMEGFVAGFVNQLGSLRMIREFV